MALNVSFTKFSLVSYGHSCIFVMYQYDSFLTKVYQWCLFSSPSFLWLKLIALSASCMFGFFSDGSCVLGMSQFPRILSWSI